MKRLLTTIVALAGLVCPNAQEPEPSNYRLMRVHTANTSKVMEFEVSNVSEIDFVTLAYNETDEHEYVDLGLTSGTLWATCNVGARTPWEYGDYFGWAETVTKEKFGWADYKYGAEKDQLQKYCNNAEYGQTVDDLLVLEPADDAATVNWGDEWRTPTMAELNELANECTWAWTTMMGVKGCKVSSKVYPDRFIFLPATGFKHDTHRRATEYAYYWSSEASADSCYTAKALYTGLSTHTDIHDRYCGRCVRAVRTATDATE